MNKKTDLETVGAMHQCKKGEAFSTCTHCGAMAEQLAKPCPHFMRQAGEMLEARASLPAAGQEPVADAALQNFESPRAKILMRAWQEGWEACRDSEYVGEDAQNDAFNQSGTVNHCVAEDILYAAPQPAVAAGWVPIETAPKDTLILLYGAKRLKFAVGMHHSRDGWVSDSTSEFLSMYPPTHWMHIPPAPSTEGEARG